MTYTTARDLAIFALIAATLGLIIASVGTYVSLRGHRLQQAAGITPLFSRKNYIISLCTTLCTTLVLFCYASMILHWLPVNSITIALSTLSAVMSLIFAMWNIVLSTQARQKLKKVNR